MASLRDDNPGVSIIIINYNTMEYIFKLLDSIKRFIKYEPLEVIVIDNMSTDGSREALELYSGIRYIKGTSNVGHGPALHAGILESKYPFVLTMDADSVILKEGLIEASFDSMKDENTFAAGWIQLVNSYGFWIPVKQKDPKSVFDYFRPTCSIIRRQVLKTIHPSLALINKQIYLERLTNNFIAHGTPGIEVYYEIHNINKRQGGGEIKLAQIIRWQDFVHHYWAGSQNKEGAYMAAHRLSKAKGAPLFADADFPIKIFIIDLINRLGITRFTRRMIRRSAD